MRIKYFILFFLVFSCQKIETINPIVFDNSQLKKITIASSVIEINELYEMKFSEPYIDHSLQNSPLERLKLWMNENLNYIGNENKFIINILDASLKRTELNNPEAKKFDEKIIYKYELFYLVEYSLYDNSNFLKASTTVESYRSTTSGMYISLQEKERIIDDLILLCLIDFTEESKKLIEEYMKKYIL
tara:strand:+ start:71 stop:634 length:564 start_codon:yes stop_codon:yes gene_type:complete